MEYQIIRSNRKTAALQINDRGELLVRCPRQMSDAQVADFVERHRSWIQKHLKRCPVLPRFTSGELEALVQKACAVIPPRVQYWAKQMGISYVEYLRNLRIKRAVFLMEQGVASVKNVAILSGFEDALYFSKVFKQAEGVTPSEYIKNLSEQQ